MTKKIRKQSPNDNDIKKMKKKGKKLKYLGSVILLAAFATQNITLDFLNSKIAKRFEAYQIYSHAYNSNLLYQNLFYNQAQVTEVADGNVLKKAAIDNLSGFGVEIRYSDISQKEKERKLNTLLSEAKKIIDIDSFNNFMETFSNEEADYREQVKGDYSQAVALKKYNYALYIILYITGSFFYIRSIKYE